MRVWLIRDGELFPTDGANIRLTRFGLIANEMAKSGHEVLCWTSNFVHSQKKFRNYQDGKILVNNSVQYQIFLLGGCGYQKNISLRRMIHNHQVAHKFTHFAATEPKPDIILAATATIELTWAAVKFGRNNRVPVIIDCLEMWPDIMVMIQPKWLQPLARLALSEQFIKIKWACHHATAIFTYSQPFLDWALNYAGRKKNAFDAVYHLGYPEEPITENLLAEGEAFWKPYKLRESENDFVLAFVGSLTRSFNFEPIIEAIKQLGPNFKLVIAGNGPMQEKYFSLTKGCPNIILPGLIEKHEMQVLFAQAHVGVAPYISRRDFLTVINNKIADYTAAKLPIISSIDGLLGDFLKQNQCGLVYNHKVDNLIAILKKLQADPKLLSMMSQNAYTIFKKELAAEKIYPKMRNNLENIALKFQSNGISI